MTLAIVGILAALAAPSMTNFIQYLRVNSEISGFISDLGYVRAEAVKEGQTVTMCASSDGKTCSGSNNWQNGWIIFSDPNLTKATTSTTPVLRKQVAWLKTDTFVADNSASFVTFTSDGFTRNLPGTSVVTFTLHTNPVNAYASKCVSLNKAGRHQLQSPGTGNCT